MNELEQVRAVVKKILHELFKPRADEELKRFNGLAIVDELIHPAARGRVRFRSSLWPARCEQLTSICQGRTVEVIGVEGITLVVRPVSLLPPPSI